jgi:hypothetical protein
MIVPPFANQPIAHQFPPTREHHQFLLGLHEGLLLAQRPILTVGPFYINDLPASATTQATQAFFNTATAVSRSNINPVMPLAGRVVGISVTTDDSRVTGTATARIIINGTGAAWNSGSVVINGTSVFRAANLIAWAAAEDYAFNAFDAVGLEVETSSWSPTTANLTGFLFVQLEAPT